MHVSYHWFVSLSLCYQVDENEFSYCSRNTPKLVAIQYALHRFIGCVLFSSIFSFPQVEVTSSYTGPVCPTCCCWCELCWDQCLQMQYYTKTLTRTLQTSLLQCVQLQSPSVLRESTAAPVGEEKYNLLSNMIIMPCMATSNTEKLKAILSIFTWQTLRCTTIPYTTSLAHPSC